MICYDCLGYFETLGYDKGFRVCQKCFGRRYSKKYRHIEEKTPTFKDLKRLWEKDF